MTKFYRIVIGSKADAWWYLQSPLDAKGREIDAREFTYGTRYIGDTPLQVPLGHYGEHVDFNFADFDMIVIPAKINDEMERKLKVQVQRFPVVIESGIQGYEILNVLDLVTCIDEDNSVFSKWTKKDGIPHMVGKYRMFPRLQINPKMAEGHHLFILAEWKVALIASEVMKNFLEDRAVTGIEFEPVN
ncbi:MAG: hypothetical protein R8K20_03050 [Gallionellaceae bacterium]